MATPKYSPADVIARTAPLSQTARALLRPGWSTQQSLDALRDAELHVDCLNYLPHVLDKRRAVWWACLCCFHGFGEAMSAALGDALTSALHWVEEPSEEHRRACLDNDEIRMIDSVENCLRMAVYWSGGSLLAPPLPELPPPPDVTPQLSTAAVLEAAASAGMFAIAERHRLYVDLGYEVLDGRLLWTEREATMPAATIAAGVA